MLVLRRIQINRNALRLLVQSNFFYVDAVRFKSRFCRSRRSFILFSRYVIYVILLYFNLRIIAADNVQCRRYKAYYRLDHNQRNYYAEYRSHVFASLSFRQYNVAHNRQYSYCAHCNNPLSHLLYPVSATDYYKCQYTEHKSHGKYQHRQKG